MSRLYATLALFAFVSLAWWQYSSAITDREKYRAELAEYKAELEVANKLIAEKELLLVEANQRATRYLADKREVENEAKANRDCIANNTCGVSVRYKEAICASLSNSVTTKPGTNDSTGTGVGDFARWYVSLEEAIKKNNLKIIALQEDLAIRADPNACISTVNKGQ